MGRHSAAIAAMVSAATRTSVAAELVNAPEGFEQLPGVHELEVGDHRLRCAVDTAQLDPLLERLTACGVRSLTCQPPTLEQLFLRHYDQNAAVAEPAPVSAGTASAGTASTASS